MKIRIASLQNGLNNLQETILPVKLDLDEQIFRWPVVVDIIADKRIGKIIVDIEARTEGEFICDRCGEPFLVGVGDRYEVIFIQRESPLPGEIPGDDLRTYSPVQDELDLTTEVRDAVLLSVPLKLLCRDDCRGLCQHCGANLNIETCRCEINIKS